MNWRDTDVTAYIQDPFRRNDLLGKIGNSISIEECSEVFRRVKDCLTVLKQSDIQNVIEK